MEVFGNIFLRKMILGTVCFFFLKTEQEIWRCLGVFSAENGYWVLFGFSS